MNNDTAATTTHSVEAMTIASSRHSRLSMTIELFCTVITNGALAFVRL